MPALGKKMLWIKTVQIPSQKDPLCIQEGGQFLFSLYWISLEQEFQNVYGDLASYQALIKVLSYRSIQPIFIYRFR